MAEGKAEGKGILHWKILIKSKERGKKIGIDT